MATPLEPLPQVAKQEAKKTNACRALDALGIDYELKRYAVDESDLSAASVAEKVGMNVEQVFKTLCLRASDQTILLAVIPGNEELDLKLVARAAEKKSVEPVAVKELSRLTGYVRGGVTALACSKPYPVYVDELVELHDLVSVSAGQRGLQIWLAPRDYIRACKATLAPLCR